MAADRNNTITKGSVLVGVLWLTGILMALLAVAAQSSRLDGRVSLSALEKIRCRWLCRAGAETALAILNQDLKETDSLLDDWADNPDELTQVPMEGGTFTITITDECSKLNLNLAKATQLMGLTTEGMDETLSDSIQDWRDADEEARTSGAENGYYANLNYGYFCRNGWFRSPREVLRVRGMTDELFYGQNNRSLGRGGLSRYVTCYSAVINKDASGNARVNVNSASESELTGKLSLSSEQAKWVVQNRPFRSLGDLVTAKTQSGSSSSRGESGSGRSTGSGGSPQSGRPSSLLDADRLLPLAGGYTGWQFSPSLATRPALLAADAGGGQDGGRRGDRGGRGGRDGQGGGGRGGQDGGGRGGDQGGGGRGGQGGQDGGGQGGGSPAGGGSSETTAKPLDWATLSRIADQIALRSDEYLYGMMNVNTATAEALTAFFDGDVNLAAKVIEFRESQGGVITSVFDLASVEGMGQDTLKKYIDRLSVRSSIFFVRVVARSAACGLEYYLEMIVNRDRTGREVLYRLEGIGH